MITRIDVDGIDKVGKGILIQYLCDILNYEYIINDRGLLSQLVYNELNNRGKDYKDIINDYKNTLIIHLTADTHDLKIRHKINNEPAIDIEQHKKLFDKYSKILETNGIIVKEYNTTQFTPMMIACMTKLDLEELK